MTRACKSKNPTSEQLNVTVTLNRIWYSVDYSLMIEMKTAYILLGSFEMLFSISTAADFFVRF